MVFKRDLGNRLVGGDKLRGCMPKPLEDDVLRERLAGLRFEHMAEPIVTVARHFCKLMQAQPFFKMLINILLNVVYALIMHG